MIAVNSWWGYIKRCYNLAPLIYLLWCYKLSCKKWIFYWNYEVFDITSNVHLHIKYCVKWYVLVLSSNFDCFRKFVKIENAITSETIFLWSEILSQQQQQQPPPPHPPVKKKKLRAFLFKKNSTKDSIFCAGPTFYWIMSFNELQNQFSGLFPTVDEDIQLNLIYGQLHIKFEFYYALPTFD
jgi:hypothetical protein